MASETREIPREDWKAQLDEFSKQLSGAPATLEIDGEEVGAQVEAEGTKLSSITYDRGDDIVVIGIDAGGGLGEDAEHIISAPNTVYVLTEDGETVLDITDAEGVQTLLRVERRAGA